ncbi:MAG: P-loop NTPase [Candidatus Kaiserbacteria bacterium]|nr:P-loop NTPase [Candidatus Kaiserbacteria bacterium]
MDCGKGGVGKTLIATSLAAFLAHEGERTALLDTDGGHNVMRTLGFEKQLPINSLCEVAHNLDVAVVEPAKYVNIADWKATDKPLDGYFAQFPADSGGIAILDMALKFFGIIVDITTVQKFMSIVALLHEAEKRRLANVIIDVEPTAGLKLLLNNAEASMRSLRNMRSTGKIALAVLNVKWGDIAAFLTGEYIAKVDFYCHRIERALEWLRHASYIIVCKPELAPVLQGIEVSRIIESFGGRIHGCVVNEIRGEVHERGALESLPKKWAVIQVKRIPELHIPGGDLWPVLRNVGRLVSPLVAVHINEPERD